MNEEIGKRETEKEKNEEKEAKRAKESFFFFRW